MFDIIFEIIPTSGKLKAEFLNMLIETTHTYLCAFEELYCVHFQHTLVDFIFILVHLWTVRNVNVYLFEINI